MLQEFLVYSTEPNKINFHLINDPMSFTASYSVTGPGGYSYSRIQNIFSTEKTLQLSDVLENQTYNYTVDVFFEDGSTHTYSGNVSTRKSLSVPSAHTYNVVVTTTERLLSSLVPNGLPKSSGKRMTITGNNNFQIKFSSDSDYVTLIGGTTHVFNYVSDCFLRTSSGTSNVTIILDGVSGG
ncbi:MAG: hypothetical protein ABIK31_02770 [candidate division WOR-3 bacterium]